VSNDMMEKNEEEGRRWERLKLLYPGLSVICVVPSEWTVYWTCSVIRPSAEHVYTFLMQMNDVAGKSMERRTEQEVIVANFLAQ